MPEILAQAAEQPAAPWWASTWVLLGGMVAIWWFLLIRPQRQQEKSRKGKLESLKKGDKVLTRAGIVGVVSRVKEDTVILRIDVDGKVHVPFAKTAIEDLLSDDGSDA